MVKEAILNHPENEDNNQIITNEDKENISFITILKKHFGTDELDMNTVVRTEEFENLFYYSGNDLGNVYTPDKTTFRLWSPTASEAKLVMYQKWDDKTGKEMAMKPR